MACCIHIFMYFTSIMISGKYIGRGRTFNDSASEKFRLNEKTTRYFVSQSSAYKHMKIDEVNK
jgi:hypothetical protein